MRATMLRVLAVSLSVGLVACSGEKPKETALPPAAPAPETLFTAGKFSRSVTCKACHVDIFQYWSVSAHATSFRNTNFQTALFQLEKAAGSAAKTPCLGCHAPLTTHEGKLSDNELADEGIGCDFCHTVTAVDLTNSAKPYKLEPGPIKRGPVQDAKSERHQVAYTPLHKESLFCAGCHEFKGKGGLPIISTYTEWLASPAAKEGKSCQVCHMPVETGSVVDPKVKRTDVPVNTHRMPGGHSRNQLRQALTLKIDDIKQAGDQVIVKVSVENKGAGHSVPTGMPTRRFVLEVEAATPGGKTLREERVFQKQLVDAKGLPVDSDAGAFVDATTLARDTRIAAGENRVEEFKFAIPHNEKVAVRAALVYSYSPSPENLPEERIRVVSVEKSIEGR